jgi:hypothetical protein
MSLRPILHLIVPLLLCHTESAPAAPPYEVNTHQVMARLAAGRSLNLRHFLADMGLTEAEYSDLYPERVLAQFAIFAQVPGRNARDIIEAGAILEDRTDPEYDNRWRFNRHFLDPTDNNRGLNFGFLKTFQSAATWGLTGGAETNDQSWEKALTEYFENATVGKIPDDRRKNQESLFVTLGHVIHLIQDLCQPSHTRNDAHAGDFTSTGRAVIEDWGRFNVFLGSVPPSIAAVINARGPIYRPTVMEYFTQAAIFSNRNFFSDDTIFKGGYRSPSRNPASTGTRTDDTNDFGKLNFRVSKQLVLPGTIDGVRLSQITKDKKNRDVEHLPSVGHFVVRDNFTLLMPRAVSLSEGLINHFFRGRIRITTDGNDVRISNASDLSAVSNLNQNVLFRDGEILVSYESESGQMVRMPGNDIRPINMLVHGSSVDVPGDLIAQMTALRTAQQDPDLRPRADLRVTMVYKGLIGPEAGVAAARVSLKTAFGTYFGTIRRGFLGRSVANAGDVNKDGVNDVLIGIPGTGAFSIREPGSAQIRSGVTGEVLFSFVGLAPEDQFGESVSGAGDVNNDGHADVIIGSSRRGGPSRPSYAHVYSGKDGGLLWRFTGGPQDSFGSSVSGAGDINKDGHDDVIVGARQFNGSGYARVLSGKDGSELYTFTGDDDNDRFGYSVSGAGDVNNDGFPDLIVGALWDDDTFQTAGSARVFSGKDGTLLYSFHGSADKQHFGSVVSGAGDVNQDGFDDIMAGTTRNLGTPNGVNGLVRVYSGRDGTLLYTLVGVPGTFNGFGGDFGPFGDVNDDGHPDLIVTQRRSGIPATGVVRVFSGKDGTLLGDFTGSGDNSFPTSAACLGDLDSDGHVDLIVGAQSEDSPAVGSDHGAAHIISGAAFKPIQ